MTPDELQELATSRAPSSVVYHDVSADISAPQLTLDGRRRAALDALRESGAPEADVDAVDRELQRPPAIGSPSARFLVVRDGAVMLSEDFPGAPRARESAAFGTVVDLVPLLRHLAAEVRYLVVEAGRDGGELRLCRAPGRAGEQVAEVQGREDTLTKVGSGGWAHRNMQAHTEEIWRQTEGLLAEEVDRVVRDRHPRFVILAGDVRADQLLKDQLGPVSRDLVRVVDANTRAAGAADDAVDAAVLEELERLGDADREDAAGRIGARGGARGARGVGEVVTALQASDVDTLLLAPERVEDRTLLALGGPPWLATDESMTAGVDVLGEVAAATALVRAAVATGARVLFDRADDPLDASGVSAALRGELGPARPAE